MTSRGPMTAWREPRTLLIGLFVLAFASGDVGDLDLADGGAGATDQFDEVPSPIWAW